MPSIRMARDANGASITTIKPGGRIMKRTTILSAVVLTLAGSAAVVAAQAPPQQPMSFFVTSTVPGTGNLGGLAGADQICQNLAAAAGAGNKTWHAYLSQQAQGNTPAGDARRRP